MLRAFAFTGGHILVHHHLATEGVADPHHDLGAGLILSQGPDLPCQIESNMPNAQVIYISTCVFVL